jgi:hypothetical protein
MPKYYNKLFALCCYLQITILSILMRTSTTNAQVLTTFQAYENLRVNAANVTRIQSIDVVESEDGNTPFCHLAMVMPFSQTRPERTPVDQGVFQGQAAVMLAIEHLNTGNGAVVEEVEGLDQRCPIKFTAEIFDSSFSQTEAVDTVINLVSRQPAIEQIPCAYLGARWSSVSIPTSTVTGLKGYPQISPLSTSARLDDKGQFPLFGRTIPSDAATAVPAILYLRYQLGVKHLVIVHVNDAYGDAYALGLQLAAEEYAPDMKVQSISFEFDITEEIAERTVRLVKETNYRYIFGIFFSNVQYEPFMTEAYNQGIAGTGEYFWMFSDSVSPSFFDGQAFAVDSPIHLASIGASRIGAVAGVPGNENYDKFFQSMNEMNNPADIELIQSKHPTYDDPNYMPSYIADNVEGFFAGVESTLVPFLYDAAIALGLAACEATKDGSYFDGSTHFDIFKKTSFGGASGNNTFDSATGSRDPSSARFILLNVVEEKRTDTTANLGTVVTDLFWNGEWESIASFVFNDGSNTPPLDLPRLEVDQNFIGWPLRGVSLAMSLLVLSLSLGFFLWTYRNRLKKVAKASQPMFLYMICAGCFLMGSSIIFMSIDDEIAPIDTCTIFCVVPPWLFCVGWILAFSALFAKTLRVNRIFHNPVAFSRIKVTVWDVIKPVVALLSVATIILLLWTVLEPPTFVREVNGFDTYGRVSETKGDCDLNESVPYAGALLFVLCGTLIYAVQQAYVARHISTEFAEAEYIFLVLVAIFMVTLLALPVLFLVEANPSARFFTLASIIFLINISILCLIFVPKIKQGRLYAQAMQKKDGDIGSNCQRYSVGRSHRVSVSGIKFDISELEKGDGPSTDDEDLDDDDSGIRILNNPKQVDRLQQKIETLKIEIDVLRRKRNVTALPSLAETGEEKVNRADELSEEYEDLRLEEKQNGASTNESDGPKRKSVLSPSRRIDMAGELYEENVG